MITQIFVLIMYFSLVSTHPPPSSIPPQQVTVAEKVLDFLNFVIDGVKTMLKAGKLEQGPAFTLNDTQTPNVTNLITTGIHNISSTIKSALQLPSNSTKNIFSSIFKSIMNDKSAGFSVSQYPNNVGVRPQTTQHLELQPITLPIQSATTFATTSIPLSLPVSQSNSIIQAATSPSVTLVYATPVMSSIPITTHAPVVQTYTQKLAKVVPSLQKILTTYTQALPLLVTTRPEPTTMTSEGTKPYNQQNNQNLDSRKNSSRSTENDSDSGSGFQRILSSIMNIGS